VRTRALLIVVVGALLLAACSSNTRSGGTAGPDTPGAQSAAVAGGQTATRVVVVRPVTRAGVPASGYTAVPDSAGGLSITCTESSPVAVDAGIASCSPSASYAVACWASSTQGQAMCMRDPWGTQVTVVPMQGAFPSALTPPATAEPLGLELADGTHCTLRVGGAGEALAGKPTWSAYYFCGTDRDTAVWAPTTTSPIDRSEPVWTVQVASSDGTGALHTDRIRTVYMVGTAA
jgi:predicted small secreted protein